ncbi:MAG: hypothetical protein JHC87_01605 [Thermoleophilaceae bacterium]|nr:hypothetical protein [Thermoleophilaceae bacterium]
MRKPIILTTVLATVVAAAALAGPAAAEIIEVGDTGQVAPAPACPQTDTCQAIGRITGYQIQIGETRNPFRVAKDGHVVALTLTLPVPTAKQMTFFNDVFGGAPAVRVAILRPRPVKGQRYRYALAGQSETFALTSFLGSNPQFALARSLSVKKDDVIALTVDTWIPAFAVNLDKTNAWRSSRDAKACDDVQKSAMHDKRGSIKQYGCLYRTARLLYSATVVVDPKKTSK